MCGTKRYGVYPWLTRSLGFFYWQGTQTKETTYQIALFKLASLGPAITFVTFIIGYQLYTNKWQQTAISWDVLISSSFDFHLASWRSCSPHWQNLVHVTTDWQSRDHFFKFSLVNSISENRILIQFRDYNGNFCSASSFHGSWYEVSQCYVVSWELHRLRRFLPSNHSDIVIDILTFLRKGRLISASTHGHKEVTCSWTVIKSTPIFLIPLFLFRCYIMPPRYYLLNFYLTLFKLTKAPHNGYCNLV